MKKTMLGIAAVFFIGAAGVPAAAEVKIGDSAPAFILKDAQETSTYSLESYRKKQIVLVNFFATWCENCQEEMATLKELHAKYKDSGLQVISVSVQERPEKVRRFIAKYQLPFTVLLDQDTSTAKKYGLAGFPYNMVIDGNGTVRFAGSRPPADFEKLLNELKPTLASAAPVAAAKAGTAVRTGKR